METRLNPVTQPAQENKLNVKPDSHILAGYGLLLVSFLLFAFIDQHTLEQRSSQFTVFVIHYFLALTYVGILIYGKSFGIRRSWRKENFSKTIILLNLFLISAYALNREIPVFESSTDWLSAYLLITSLTTLSFHYFKSLPTWVNQIQYLLLGSAFVLYLYLMLFVANFYPVGTIGLLFFGIGGHIFVPATLFIACLLLLINNYGEKPVSNLWIVGGFVVTIFCCVVFIHVWNNRVAKIETLANQSVMHDNAELPVWIEVAKSMTNDWITLRILKSDLVYSTQDKSGDWELMPQPVSWDESRKHDPLVFLSTLISKCTLPAEDRVKILQAITESRHNANERLWSGDNLTTSYIVSDIDIYPDLRIAYTEKYLNIKNNSARRWWGNTQEAIYTFQLPEGSVVTSLSLWINGKEEKGILTSKQKATKAYKTIVGVESRDPSIVHWQEGNAVTVRIFPCTKEEERKFKIGITSPLIERDGHTVYKNITFRGPDHYEARETLRVRIKGDNMITDMPGFVKDKDGNYLREKTYDPEFELMIPAVPLKQNNRFTFQGYRYSLRKANPVFQDATLNAVYLDINNSWTSKEIKEMKELLENKKVFIYNQEDFVELNNDNFDLTFKLLEENFSVFPFHNVKDTEHSIVVTKGKSLSPHLSDFKDSKFANGLSEFFASGKKMYCYNLGESISPYISSLRELRALEFSQGDANQLKEWLNNNKYPNIVENDESVTLHDANLVITKTKTELVSPDNAPDHLARLFAYNDILRKVGTNYFKNDFIDQELVDEAATAYVVSPVSSLIVLETQEDYKRFDINDTAESLKNASKQSSGAVPEPHEWALIILLALLILYLKIGKKIFQTSYELDCKP